MKTILKAALVATLLPATLMADEVVSYSNYIRQYQAPFSVVWDDQRIVDPTGSNASELAINPGGATFKLGTIKSSSLTGLTAYHLATSTVGTVPVTTIVIRSEDTASLIPRTRADRPFWVDVSVDAIQVGNEFPPESKAVTFYRHVQEYGPPGTGVGINRTQATQLSQSTISTNGTQTLTFAINEVPGANRAKVRGEERFSLFSVVGPNFPVSELSTQRIQIWPVADGTISGLAQNEVIRFAMPEVTIALHDLYPLSTTYVQVYKGEPRLGVTGTRIPSALITAEAVPKDAVLKLEDYDKLLRDDGRWTMEVLTSTPFGIDRLAYVSFTLDRTIEVNSTVTTVE
ncbi:MAG: hypothetical protein V4640_12210 [Verrucomicrobiota bacterium]